MSSEGAQDELGEKLKMSSEKLKKSSEKAQDELRDGSR